VNILKEKFNCYVYHIHLEGRDTSQGYIGVSKNPSARYEHHRNRTENPHLRNAMNLYKNGLVYDIIFQGEEYYCYELEAELRPEKNMGWNINIGGSKPPSPKGEPHCVGNLPPEKRRKNYRHSAEVRLKLKEIIGSAEVRKKISESKLGDKNPFYKARGKRNPNFQGFYVTPDGVFESHYDISCFYGITRNAVSRRFSSNTVIKPNRWQSKEYWGKTWNQMGWEFIGDRVMSYSKLCKKVGWKLPRIYFFKDYEDLKFLVENLENLEEGVVLYKEGVPTVKLKNSLYLVCHRLKGQGLNPKRILELVLMNEVDEYLAVFPEDAEHFEPYIKANVLLESTIAFTHKSTQGVTDQKEYAMKVKDYCYSGVLFSGRKQSKDPIQVLHSMEESYRLKLLMQFMKENDL